MSQPWMKFFPADWRADPCLQLCSVGARGLWMEMLCIMHEASPRGSLVINGKQVSSKQLTTLAGGCSPRETNAWLEELEAAGVFSRDPDGTIYSRRVRKDIAKAERDRENGRQGGNPGITPRSAPDNPGVNPPLNPPDNGGLKAHMPEARIQIPEKDDCPKPDKPVRTRNEYDGEFEDWWKGYPTDRNMSKLDAHKAWRRLSNEQRAVAIAANPSFRAWCEEAWKTGYRTLHAVRYLNQRRFDGHATEMSGPKAADRVIDFGNGYKAPLGTIRGLVALGRWNAHWGPRPGEVGCRIDPKLLASGDAPPPASSGALH